MSCKMHDFACLSFCHSNTCWFIFFSFATLSLVPWSGKKSGDSWSQSVLWNVSASQWQRLFRNTSVYLKKKKTDVVDLFSLHFLKALTFQMVPTDGVQAVVHPGEGVNGSLCVHILLPSPHVHYGVVTVEPGNILSIVNSSCITRTHSHGFSSISHTLLYHSI